jgi:hypothetical protein
MKNAHPEKTKVSALDKSHFSIASTTPCYCWRGNARISFACSTCRGWFNLAARFLVGGAHHAN